MIPEGASIRTNPPTHPIPKNMVTYSVEEINSILFPIRQVPGRPTFCTLWKLSQEFKECLGKMEHTYHLDEEYAGYIMTQAAYKLSSTTRCQDTVNVDNCFIVPATAITDTNQKYEERKWQSRKNLLDAYLNMRTALRKIFERDIGPAYRSGRMMNTGMERRVFGNEEAPAILELHKILYGTPSLQELDQALFFLHDPMYCNQPVEVMLRTTEEVQMFLMADPDEYRELSNVNLISYAMVKISKCGVLYTKAIERW